MGLEDTAILLKKTYDDVVFSAEWCAEAQPGMAAKKKEEISAEFSQHLGNFFGQYGIKLPDLNDERAISEGLKAMPKEKINSISGVTSLAGKVFFYARDAGVNPCDCVKGLLGTLSGLPENEFVKAEQAYCLQEAATVRDKISVMISLGKGQPVNYMLVALQDALPKAAEKARAYGEKAQMGLIGSVLEDINSANNSVITGLNSKLPDFNDVIGAYIPGILRRTIEEAETKKEKLALTPARIEEICDGIRANGKESAKAAFEREFGMPVKTLGFSSHSSGANRTLEIYYLSGRGSPEKTTVRYGTNTMPPWQLNVLTSIQNECLTGLKPTDSLFGTATSCSKNLHYLAGR